jgi:hypothetical protein
MVGIIVSGGTYSGSGDVTAQFFKTTGSGWEVALPDGTLELYGESGSWTMINNWSGDSNSWNHNEGTVKVSENNTILYAIGVNPTKGHLYNLKIDGGVDGRGVNGVQLSSATSGTHLRIKNDLTVISGTTKMTTTQGNNGWLLEVSGHCLVQQSGAAVFGDASFMNGGYNQTAYGLVKVASLQVNDNGYFSASSGTTDINGAPNGGYSVYIPDGGFYHSSGTVDVRFTGTDASQVRNKDPFYNLEQTLGASSHRVNWRGDGSSPYQFTIANDLTIREGSFRPVNAAYSIVVSGNVKVESGGNYGYVAGDFEAAATFGSLYLDTGNAYLSTGTTTINNNDGSYKFRAEGNPTIVHNSGTVVLDASTNGGMYKNTGSNGKFLYNLIVKNTTTSQRAIQNVYGVSVANNLTVSGAGSDEASWDVGFYNAGDGGYVVSGLTTIINGAKLGRSVSSDSTFGKLTIGAKGWYDAPTGSFTLKDDFTIASDDTTFTHNSGTAIIAGAVELLPADYDSSETARHVFWDISQTGPGTFYIERPTVLERNFTKSGGDLTHYTKLTCGTDTSASTIAVNSGEWKMYGYYGDPYLYAKNEAFPVTVTGSVTDPINWDQVDNVARGTKNHIKWIYYTKDTTTGGNKARIVLDGASEFQAMTISANDNVDASNAMLTLNGTMTTAAEGIIVSGALVNMKGAGNWSETGYQQHIGRATAALMWNSTGYYSPNGGYLNNGWKDVFWNADARINQDGPFRNSNLIVAKQFSASNRPIGSTTESQMLKSIRVLNGGTVSSSTNLFKIQNTGTFNTRGGFFASSSAFYGDNDHYIQSDAAVAISSNQATYEGWFKATNNGYLFTHYGSSYGFYSRFDGGNLNFYFRGPDAGVFTDVAGLMDSNWHHIAVVVNNTDYKLYIDGELLQHKTAGAYGNPNAVFRVGGVTNYWDGVISNARIFQDARTGAEIRSNMFAETPTGDNLVLNYVFNEGYGTVINDSANSNDGKIYGVTSGVAEASWVAAGNWNANTLSGAAHTGKLYIGTGVTPTVFTNSTFEVANRELIVGSKFASKSHKGTTEYYIATSGTNDYLNYQKLEEAAAIGTVSDVKILANGSNRSYFNFDSNANNEQCNTLVNAGYIRIVTNADFYTQDFDNSQGEWIRSDVYGGTIHDDGSTPHEYEPIDLMDDLDSNFDTSELID